MLVVITITIVMMVAVEFFGGFFELERSASTGGASLDEVSIVEVLI